MKIVRAEQTLAACPSEWNAWTSDGQYLYLRFRHGTGKVQDEHDNVLARFDTPDAPDLDGTITLTEFARRAGITLALPEPDEPSTDDLTRILRDVRKRE